MSNEKKNSANAREMNYVLIDFENVQPKNVQILEGKPFRVLIFVGARQTKLPTQLVTAIQAPGKQADYVEISGSGPNALDFHIAYYIGRLAADDPQGHFYIISRDTGFDTLIKHLNGRNIDIRRVKDLAEIPALRVSANTSTDKKINLIVKNLRGIGQSRPRKVKTLQNTIKHFFSDDLGEAEPASLAQELRKRKLIVVIQEKVSYKLPQ